MRKPKTSWYGTHDDSPMVRTLVALTTELERPRTKHREANRVGGDAKYWRRNFHLAAEGYRHVIKGTAS